MTAGLSADYRKNERTIASEPVITIDDWRSAAVWANDGRRNEIKFENGDIIVVSSKALNENWEMRKDSVQLLQNTNWRSFDQFIKQGFGFFWTVTLGTNWKCESKCDCPYFLKHYMCKHVIGLALRTKICKLPRAAIPTLLGAKAKAGRKGKAKKTLLTQKIKKK